MLANQRLILVTGKGGVGRTTIASALSYWISQQGKRTLLAQINAKKNLGPLLGVAEVGEEIRLVSPNLWAVNTNPSAALKEYGLMILHYQAVYRAVFENRMVKGFLRAIPGLDDYAMLGKLWYHTTELQSDGSPRFDTIIVDCPATGHAVTFLRTPQIILDTVPEGPLTRDARAVRELLTDPARTRLVIVTLAEDMPANEALDFYRSVKSPLQIPTGPLIVNALYPDRFTKEGMPAQVLTDLTRDSALPLPDWFNPLLVRAQLTRYRRALNEHYLAQLRDRIPMPQAHLPHLFTLQFDLSAIKLLSKLLAEQLSASP